MMKKLQSDISISVTIQQIGKLFNCKTLQTGNFHNWFTAMDYLSGAGLPVPEGLVTSDILTTPLNVPGTLLNLSAKCWLIKNCEELFDEDNQCYVVVADSSLTGADKLFLCAVGLYDRVNEAEADILYHVKSWYKLSDENAPIMITGSKKLKDKYIVVQAVQLSSFKTIRDD